MFAAGNKELEVVGTIKLPVIVGTMKTTCIFIVITNILNYVIMGFDFIRPQGLLIHETMGVIHYNFQRNQHKIDNIYQHLHVKKCKSDSVNFCTNIQDVHSCIDVITKQDEELQPESSKNISALINFKDARQNCNNNRDIVISSECLQPHIGDWNDLQIFFQLVKAEKEVNIIFTNKSSHLIRLPAKTVIGCAEYCYCPVQIDPRIQVNKAPMTKILNTMDQKIFEAFVSFSNH